MAGASAGSCVPWQQNLRSLLTSPAVAIATVLGAGLFPVAPGTVGSALALPLVYFLRPLSAEGRGLVYLVMFLVCVWAVHSAGRQLDDPDHRIIICDETWGMAVVFECTPTDWHWILVSFLAFRLIDIVKPWPISMIDRRMRNGLGVMLDDGIASVGTILLILALRMAIVGAE